ncbi:MAG: hypothetical protein AAF740_05105 [Bacteroidota bacterium]
MKLDTLLQELNAHFGFPESWLQKLSGLSASEQKAALDTHLKNEGREAEFYQALREWIKVERRKNVIEGGEYNVQGNVHIGDTNPESDNYTEKNILKGVKMEVSGDFRLGDVSGGGSSNPSRSEPKATPATLLTETAALIAKGKIAEAVAQLLERSELTTELQHNLVLLSGQLTNAQRSHRLGILPFSELQREEARIGKAVLEVLRA